MIRLRERLIKCNSKKLSCSGARGYAAFSKKKTLLAIGTDECIVLRRSVRP